MSGSIIIILLYTMWSLYSGWKFMDGRVSALEKDGILPLIGKLICVVVAGYFYGAIRLFILLFAFIWKIIH